jgi:signal peptidase II
MKKHIYAGILLLTTLILDIITKFLVVSHISLHERINVLGTFVQLTLVYNQGGLFGILQGYQSLFLIVSLMVLGLLILFYVYEKNKSSLFCSAMALIASGAIGNILDRFLGMVGLANRPGVVDFVYIGDDNVFRWPAFNVADAVIVIGAILLIIVFYLEERHKRAEGKG